MGVVESKPCKVYSQLIDEGVKGQSKTIRSQKVKNIISARDVGMPETLFESFKKGVMLNPSGNCLGERVKNADGSFGNYYTWISYLETYNIALQIGSGMVNLGIIPHTPVALYSINMPAWVKVEQACNAFSYITVPLYDTLGADAAEYITNETKLPIIFLSKSRLRISVEDIATKCQCVKYIVQFEDDAFPSDIISKAEGLHLTMLTLKQLMELGKHKMQTPVLPKPDDCATICYTSGTTGNPKGAMISHKNFCSAIAANEVNNDIKITNKDIHMSYLPLAHIFERLLQVGYWQNGCSVGFFSGDIVNLLSDVAVLKPTVFPSVPRLFNRIYDKVIQGVSTAGGIKEKLFNVALQSKDYYLKEGYNTHAIWDALVFKKIRELLGGNVRLMITGAAPISDNVKTFLQVVFCAPVLEGYGMTETTGTAILCNISMPSNGINGVGVPVPCCDIMLADVPEMAYLSTDKPFPRGEICHRGNNVFSGYYNQPEKTAECFDKNGWFHSGDIGRINANGTVSIIDRKKNIFKLAQGEYVAPEKIENVYCRSIWIAQCYIHGDSLKTKLVGVVVPDQDVVMDWAKKNGNSSSFTDLCKGAELKSIIEKSMNEAATQAKLLGFEFAKAFHVESEPFSVENNLLTPTFKLKRIETKAKYSNLINEMYLSLNE